MPTLPPKQSALRRVLQSALIVGSLFLPRAADATTVYNDVADFNATGVQTLGSVWAYGSEGASLNGSFSLIPHFGSIVCGGGFPADCQQTGAQQLTYFS